MGQLRYLGVSPQEAAEFLTFVLGWSDRVPVYVDGGREPRWTALDGAELWARAHRLDERENAQIELGLPLVGGGASRAAVLWAWVVSKDSVLRASTFRPAPGLVMRFGHSAHRLILWPLAEWVPYESLVAANERLSYALHGPRTRCRPQDLRVPLPWTFMRQGRVRPAPVVLTRMELTGYARGDVVEGLKDPPARDAWRQRNG